MEFLTIPAAVQRPRPNMPPRRVVIHDPGQPMGAFGVPLAVSARGVAGFNAEPPNVRQPNGVGGYHATQDGHVQVLEAVDGNRVNGAAQANDDGLHICFCDYSSSAIAAGAALIKRWLTTYKIPPIRRRQADWDQPGIIGHNDVELAIHANGPHTDPRNFPWDLLLVSLLPAQPVPQGGDLMTTIATGQPTTNGRDATVRPVPGLGVVLGENGAHLVGSTTSGKNTVWRHHEVPTGAKLIDIADMRPNGEKAITALYDLGGGVTATFKTQIG